MKKQIRVSHALTIFLGLMVAFTLAMTLVSRIQLSQMQERLDSILILLRGDVEYTQMAPQEYVEERTADLLSGGQDFRITIVSPSGAVLADSIGRGEYENHRQREEIRRALEEGKGYSSRRSETTGEQMYYAAIRAEDGNVLRISMSMAEQNRVTYLLFGCALAGMLVGGVAAMVSAGVFHRRILKPVQELAGVAADLTAGDLRRRAKVASGDELEMLANTFNTMADSMQKTMGELREQRAHLTAVLDSLDDGVIAADTEGKVFLASGSAGRILQSEHIREGQPLEGTFILSQLSALMRRAEEEGSPIRREIERMDPEKRILNIYAAPISGGHGTLAVISDVTQLRRLEQMRSEFVANVTHELKTPLTSIRGYVDLLRSAERDEETRASFYEIIDIEAERLQNLIEDMLQLSEIESGREAASEPCCATGTLQKVLRVIRPIAEKQKVALHAQLEPGLSLRASPQRLSQLFTNLIDNAVKYNRAGGGVWVSARREGDDFVFSVKDDGIGIAPEHQERIFERFYRVDKSRSREMGGTGLGLSIVKHIVQLYEGTIRLESRPGEGSEFTVRLPLRAQCS